MLTTYQWNKADQTKETLFMLCNVIHLPEDSFKKLVKKEKLGEFNMTDWNKYMEILSAQSNFTACEVCGGPKTYVRYSNIWGNERPGKCILYPQHAYVYGVSTMIKRNVEYRTTPDAGLAMLVLGKKCKHGRYIAECRECYRILAQENIERSDAAS